MMKSGLWALCALFCAQANAQTDATVTEMAQRTLSNFECATLSPTNEGRLSFVDSGIVTGRIVLNAIDRDKEQYQRLFDKFPFELIERSGTVDFRLGVAYSTIAVNTFKRLPDTVGSAKFRAAQAAMYRDKNCDLLPKKDNAVSR